VKRARERHGRYSDLLDGALAAAFRRDRDFGGKTPAQVEAAIIKKIVDFEVKKHKRNPEWTFRGGGLSRLNDDFFLLNEFISTSQSEQFKKLCERWAQFVLTPEEFNELGRIQDETARIEARIDKVRPQFQPIWSFFVALCHALQEGEDNYLKATDAYWLGLIDEVIGETFTTPRWFAEFSQDPAPDAPAPEVPESASLPT
jgi:hypothetical protein